MKLIPHMDLKVPMCGRLFESTFVFLACHGVDVILPELCWMYYGSGGCFSMLICILNNILDMGRNVLFIITISRCVLLYGLCVCLGLIHRGLTL
jgi:hypothetical protein